MLILIQTNIIKLKMTTLLYFLGDYMILILKKWLYKKSDHEIINKLKYIISVQIVVVTHNMTYLNTCFINLFCCKFKTNYVDLKIQNICKCGQVLIKKIQNICKRDLVLLISPHRPQ
jgi:hypothetical protein